MRIHSLKQPYVPERAPPSPRKRGGPGRSKTAGPRLVKVRGSIARRVSTEEGAREYDEAALEALAVEFPTYTTPTFGLPRSAIPIEPCLQRYYHLIDEGLPNDMVSPLSQEWVHKSYEMVPEHLLSNYTDVSAMLFNFNVIVVDLFTRNIILYFCIISDGYKAEYRDGGWLHFQSEAGHIGLHPPGYQ